jgi:excisionase family DNA binding protein
LKQGADRLLGIREVAELFGVDITTVRRWEQAGHLHAVRVGPRGHRHFRQSELNQLLETREEKRD